MKYLFAALSLACFVPGVLTRTYQRAENIVGPGFYGAFDFQNIPDPTHGRVNYLDIGTAQRTGLVSTSSDSFIMKADSTTTLNPNGPGRNSIRLKSRRTYRTHVVVFDIRHMPAGCGTWPAIWTTAEAGWPSGGEIDILEGINDVGPDFISLHTSGGCSMPANRAQTGSVKGLDCNVAANSNAGCGVNPNNGASFGPAFNGAGGGWYAMERTDNYIKVWFWSKGDGSVPAEVKYGSGSINPDRWGTPTALFPNSQCNIASHFADHNLIINLTFCGDWGRGFFATAPSCQGHTSMSCEDFVNYNPGAFREAYFNFAAIRTYT